ncbi:hypothetical protein Q5741_12775 [Paenibacillus sp. JX-17]|uniref:Uncharacterized protein n=1 Tax=Paenibacillus lacisoli TaxID=3064525 RepID=A0ABT9CDF3_9BACL|nr:hypothetical protein [Paenibacillus sp. JX-17]MDO7907281.1 hypothetical protein [Paenibacillus sp. JX-17]
MSNLGECARLSQKTAILLERARRVGITDDELKTIITTGKLSGLKAAEQTGTSYEEFLSYAEEHGEDLLQAVVEGYRMTFNTNNGLKIWLFEKFGFEEGRHFLFSEGWIEGLQLRPESAELLRHTLAVNWQLLEDEDQTEGPKPYTLWIPQAHQIKD